MEFYRDFFLLRLVLSCLPWLFCRNHSLASFGIMVGESTVRKRELLCKTIWKIVLHYA